jgi:hypothetical protein
VAECKDDKGAEDGVYMDSCGREEKDTAERRRDSGTVRRCHLPVQR